MMHLVTSNPTTTLHAAAVGVLAHQGGWDEILWVTVPIIVMVGLLGVAKTRVRRASAERDGRPTDSDPRDVGAE